MAIAKGLFARPTCRVLVRNEGGSKNTSYGLAVPLRTEEVAETEAQSL
jgi:hypothetical protein